MKHTHKTITKLTSHVQCVTQIDHYSNFLLQKLKEGTIITFTQNNSTTFVSLCVKKQDNDIFLMLATSITPEEREKSIIIELPTHYCPNKMAHYESWYQKEVKVLHDTIGASRILLIWIQRSFFYRYNNAQRAKISLLPQKNIPSRKKILHYWMYFLYTRIRRRQC